jgi:hypothetical protein
MSLEAGEAAKIGRIPNSYIRQWTDEYSLNPSTIILNLTVFNRWTFACFLGARWFPIAKTTKPNQPRPLKPPNEISCGSKIASHGYELGGRCHAPQVAGPPGERRHVGGWEFLRPAAGSGQHQLEPETCSPLAFVRAGRWEVDNRPPTLSQVHDAGHTGSLTRHGPQSTIALGTPLCAEPPVSKSESCVESQRIGRYKDEDLYWFGPSQRNTLHLVWAYEVFIEGITCLASCVRLVLCVHRWASSSTATTLLLLEPCWFPASETAKPNQLSPLKP